jgi:hypothetical protein
MPLTLNFHYLPGEGTLVKQENVRWRTYFSFLQAYTLSQFLCFCPRYLPFETTANVHEEVVWQPLCTLSLTESRNRMDRPIVPTQTA